MVRCVCESHTGLPDVLPDFLQCRPPSEKNSERLLHFPDQKGLKDFDFRHAGAKNERCEEGKTHSCCPNKATFEDIYRILMSIFIKEKTVNNLKTDYNTYYV